MADRDFGKNRHPVHSLFQTKIRGLAHQQEGNGNNDDTAGQIGWFFRNRRGEEVMSWPAVVKQNRKRNIACKTRAIDKTASLKLRRSYDDGLSG